jgi:hypothetical protein
MTLFILRDVADLVPKSVRYVKRSLDSVKPIEAKPVPRSRHFIFLRRAYGRRGSTLLLAAAMNLTSLKTVSPQKVPGIKKKVA